VFEPGVGVVTSLRSSAIGDQVVSFVYFYFFNISQEIGWEEHLQNLLFCIEWDLRY